MIVGLIPARAGSKGLLQKNTRMVAGRPLIAHTIEAAHLSKLDEVVVSSDCEVCLELAGEKVGKLERPAELATDDATMLDVVKHFADLLSVRVGYNKRDAIMVLYPTYPLRTAEDINAILRAYKGKPMVGLMPLTNHPYRVVKYDEWTGRVAPVIDHDRNAHYRRQDYPTGYQFTHWACVLPMSCLDRLDSQLMCDETVGYMVPADRALDVDTEEDLRLAESVLAGRGAA